MLTTILTLILIIHFVVFVITFEIISPDYSRKNKTPEQIRKAQVYAESYERNYPFTSKITFFLLICSFIYFFSYIFLSKINTIYSAIGIKTIVYLVSLSAISLFFLMSKALSEYDNSEFIFRRDHPNFKIPLIICIYTASVIFSFLTIHFTNYALDFSKGEEHIVTVTQSLHRTTRGSKGRTNHHYEIYFNPPIKNISMIDVSSHQQSITHDNDQLKLYLKNGVFGIPYIDSKMEIVK